MAHLRFINAFDEQTIELPPRSLDQPFTVGRDSDCDLQVPSVNLSPRHCVFFQHKGRWAIQDAGSAAGTFINGVRLTAPRVLRDGDVVTLGQDADPPTIVVEGADLGPRPQTPAASTTTPNTGQAVFVASVVVPPRQAPYVASIVAPPPAEQEPYVAELVAPPEEEPYIAELVTPDVSPAPQRAANDWLSQPARTARAGVPPATASSDAGYYVPKRRGMSPLAWMVTLLLAAGVCIGGYFVYQNEHPVAVAPPTPATVFVPEASEKADNIFDMVRIQGDKHPSAAPASVVQAPAPAPMPAPASTPTPTPAPIDLPAPDAPAVALKPGGDPDDITALAGPMQTDPDKQTDEWQSIETAHSLQRGFELVKACQDFVEFHPDSKLIPEVNKYLNEGCDFIWWRRIDDLLTEDAELKTQIKSISDDWALSHDATFKKGLADQRDALREELSRNEDELRNQMGYVGLTGPNLLDRAAMAKLRAARDPKVFEQFKKTVEGSIRRSNKLPWQS